MPLYSIAVNDNSDSEMPESKQAVMKRLVEIRIHNFEYFIV